MATPRTRGTRLPLTLAGNLLWSVDGQPLLNVERLALLRAIATHGSLTAAARAVGISYKGAWQTLEAIHGVAGSALVERCAGGRGGGSTRLTPLGARLLARATRIAALHARFLTVLDAQAGDLDHELDLLRMWNMKTSARNQFAGTVCAYRAGAVNDEVELQLPGGARIVAMVTRESTGQLGLQLGAPAFALVNASSVMVALASAGLQLSARNQLRGTIAAITDGAVNHDVAIDLGGGTRIAAVVSAASCATLALAPGDAAIAVFQASDVILATLI